MDTWEPDVLAALNGVGPQNDGTVIAPAAGVMPQPVDAGGGPAASYGSQVLDIFKFGIGAYNASQQRKDMIDLRRWEATNAGLYQQGQARALYGGNGQIGVMGIVALGLIVYLAMKG